LAKDLGFYQREGLDIELIEFQGTPLALAAMISGDIDVGDGRADNSRASFGRRTGGRHGHVGRQLGIHPKRARCQNLVDHNTFFENATVIMKVNAATTKVIEEKTEQLRRFTAAIVKTARHFADNQEVWTNAITKRRTKLDRKDAAILWNGFKPSWAVNGVMNLEQYKKATEFYYQTASL
jgi:ABC-type nitrate/sulfonate/bicarbonate transport system substrate-binding protein